jgi:hypothetical protein
VCKCGTETEDIEHIECNRHQRERVTLLEELAKQNIDPGRNVKSLITTDHPKLGRILATYLQETKREI